MKSALVFVFLFMLTACQLQSHPNILPVNITQNTSDVGTPRQNGTLTTLPPNETAKPVPPFEHTYNDTYADGCGSDTDCVIVRQGYCGGARAINKDKVEEYNAYLARNDVEGRAERRQCSVTLPLSYFEAKCDATTCVALQTRSLE